MKMRLMTFDEACKAFGKKYPTKISFIDGYIFGIRKESVTFLFGLILLIFSVIGFLGLDELVNSDNSQYIPAEPLAHNQTQTVFTTDEGTYIADGLYPDGTYLLTVDGKNVLVVWQAVDGEVG